MEINYIKNEYKLLRVQEDLRYNSIVLFCQNMSANHEIHHHKKMSEKNIKEYVKLFCEILYEENDVEEYNQTS